MTPEEFADQIEHLYWKFDRREDLIKLILSAKIKWEGEAYNDGYIESANDKEDYNPNDDLDIFGNNK